LGLLAAATAGGTALQTLSPFVTAPAHHPFEWTPFFSYYEQTPLITLRHALAVVLTYCPVGFVIALAIANLHTQRWVAVASAIAIAFPIEYLEGWIVGGYPDITDVGVAVVGTFAGLWLGSAGRYSFEGAVRSAASATRSTSGIRRQSQPSGASSIESVTARR
jgi:glycopeptide antibiotics resistance protein